MWKYLCESTKTQSIDKDDTIAALSEKNVNLVKKNESLARDNRRLNMALKESIIEKNEAKKEIETQREDMNEILKQNTLLNEEIRVKIEYIKLLDELKETGRKITNTEKQNEKQDVTEEDEEDIEVLN